MIVDLFTYAPGERQMELRCRLFELYAVVDRHIALCAEGVDPTELHKFRKDAPIDAFPESEWKEVWAAFGPETGFVIGEVDEIPRRSLVDEFPFTKPAVLKMDELVYSVHYKLERPQFGSVIGMKKHFNKGPLVSMEQKRSYEAIENGGWILDYFGGESMFQKRLELSPHEQVRMARKAISEKYPREHITPMGELLWPHEGETPDWHKRGHAPNSWDLEW